MRSGLTREEEQQARDLSVKILAKAEETLRPLAREMRIMQWPPAYRAILWNAIARKAMKLAVEAGGEVGGG